MTAIDEGLAEFWEIAASADLFKDVTYGQWGLHIMSPTESRLETAEQRALRPRDFLDDDIVIGSFFGDGDVLVSAGPVAKGQRRVMVALPLDPREEWPTVAHSFEEFLSKYVSAEGDKYWEG
jgi:hypothetical protein